MCANRHGQLGVERLTDRTVALVVKRVALVVGLDPSRQAGRIESPKHTSHAASRGQWFNPQESRERRTGAAEAKDVSPAIGVFLAAVGGVAARPECVPTFAAEDVREGLLR